MTYIYLRVVVYGVIVNTGIGNTVVYLDSAIVVPDEIVVYLRVAAS